MGRASGNSHCQAISHWLKGGMYFGGCHCHAPSEHETSNTGRLRSCDYSAERRPAYIKLGKFPLRTHTALKTRESIRC